MRFLVPGKNRVSPKPCIMRLVKTKKNTCKIHIKCSKILRYSRALRCTFFGELKSSCSSKSCITRSVVCNTVFKNKKSVLLKVSTLQQVFVYLKYIQCTKTSKNVQKHAKTCISSTYLSKNVHLKFSFTKKTCKNVQKRASQIFLDPIQKRALSRSVHLEAVYLEALL